MSSFRHISEAARSHAAQLLIEFTVREQDDWATVQTLNRDYPVDQAQLDKAFSAWIASVANKRRWQELLQSVERR